MTVARFAVSFDPELARAVRKAAGAEPTSAWLADAARRKLRAQGLLRVIQEWEAEHGEITSAELQSAAEKALPRPTRKSTGRRRRP
jgi:hypothetical protein